MGANLMFAICEMEATKQQAYDNAEYLALPERYENTVKFLENDLGVSRWSDDDPTQKEVRDFLIHCIDEVYNSEERYDCGFFNRHNRMFYLTAGMSWGDDPTDVYVSFMVCECLGLTLAQPDISWLNTTTEQGEQ